MLNSKQILEMFQDKQSLPEQQDTPLTPSKNLP